jgi:hypothetical protein
MLTGSLAEPWGVGELEVLEVEHGHAGSQRDGEDVDALVDTVPAHHLRTKQLAVGRLEQELEEQRGGARVVPGVPGVVVVDLAEVDARGAQLRFGHAGAARRHVERLHDGGPLGAAVGAVAAGDRVGGDPALAVGRAGKHREHGLAG